MVCRFYNATLAIDVVDINKYISMPQAGLKDGLIRVPLGFSGDNSTSLVDIDCCG